MTSDLHIKDVNIMELAVMMRILKGERNLARIGRSLNITLQGVRYYVKRLKDAGFLNDMDITSSGYEYLSTSLTGVKKFLAESAEFLTEANGWEAICHDDIAMGDEVYLFMRNGYLHATKRKQTKSMAVAMTDGKSGKRILIKDIKGIIELKPGKLEILLIKGLCENRYAEFKEKVENLLRNKGEYFLFVLGEGAKTLVSDEACVNLFSPLKGAFDATVRGLNSKVIATEEAFNLNIEEFSRLKEEYSTTEVTVNFL